MRRLLLLSVILLSVVTGHAESLYLDLDTRLNDSTLTLQLDTTVSNPRINIAVRAAAVKASSQWSISLHSPGDTLKVVFTPSRPDFYDTFSSPTAILTLTRNGRQLSTAATGTPLGTSPGEFNTLCMTVVNNSLIISGGHKEMKRLATFNIDGFRNPEAMTVSARGMVNVSQLSISVEPLPEQKAATSWTEPSIRKYLADKNPPSPEGIWDYLDRNTTPRKAREGGRYTFAIVKSLDRPGTYDIIYLSGATVNASQWMPGMRKGRLIPTDYVDHYDLEWIDSTFTIRSSDIHASIEQSSILTVSFPLLESSLRFTRR